MMKIYHGHHGDHEEKKNCNLRVLRDLRGSNIDDQGGTQ